MEYQLKDQSKIFFDPFTGIITDDPLLQGNGEGCLDKPPTDDQIQGFIFVLTTRCNLNCTYCYSIRQNAPSTMQHDDPIRILQLEVRKETETLFINFFGGEPTLEFETIKKTTEFIKRNFAHLTVFFRITTNGTVSKQKLDYFIENKFSIVVSSDGLPDRSSALAKRVVAEKVEDNIRYLVASDAVFRVRATITSENLFDLNDSLRYWKSLGVDHIHLEPYHPIGNTVEELSLLPEKEDFVEQFTDSLDVAKRLGLWIQTGSYMNLLTPSTYFCTGASAKFRVFNPDGSVTSCYRVQSFKNVNNYFLIDDWKQKVKTENHYINTYASKIELLKRHSVYDFKECEHCEAKYICAGGCLMRNLQFGGAINRPDPWICYVRRELLKFGIIQTWHSLRAGEIPVVFGRFVFENLVIEKTAIGNTSVLPKLLKLQGIMIRKDRPYYNMFDVLGIEKSEITTYYQKISRAECI